MGYLMCLSLLLLAGKGLAIYSTKAIEGYPAGYLPDCPGSEKEAYISNKSLKHLSITVQGATDGLNVYRRKYNYYQMKELAKDPYIDFSRKTMMYVGGFLDSPSFPFAYFISAPYSRLKYNILLLDTNPFTTMEYPRAARFMRAVGRHTAKMLAELTSLGFNPKTMEIIGLSLGAHTTSYIAKNYKQLTNTSISRITGLDPSGPCFRNLGPEDRLDKSDADFVLTVMTNIDGYGMAAPVGHVNFFVNGGEFQPGEVFWMICSGFCSHARSYTVWLSALSNPDSFIGIKCDSVQQARNKQCFERTPMITNVLGLNVDKSKEGIFYLATDFTYPYYLGKKGLLKENDLLWSYAKSLNDESVVKI